MKMHEFLNMGKRMVVEYWNRLLPEELITIDNVNIHTGIDNHGIYISVMSVDNCNTRDFVVEHDTRSKKTTSYLRNKKIEPVSLGGKSR